MDADAREWMQISNSVGGAIENSPRREPRVVGQRMISPGRGGRGSFAPGGAWANSQNHPGLTAGAIICRPFGPVSSRSLVKPGSPIGMRSHRAVSTEFHASRLKRRSSTRRVPRRTAGRYLAKRGGRNQSTRNWSRWFMVRISWFSCVWCISRLIPVHSGFSFSRSTSRFTSFARRWRMRYTCPRFT